MKLAKNTYFLQRKKKY